MSKKSFKDMNPALDPLDKFFPAPVHDTHEVQHEHDVPQVQDTQKQPETQQEHDVQQERLVQGTQGKKGAKLSRINMAFTEENLEYMRIASRIDGVSVTEFVNRLIRSDSIARAKEIERVKEIFKCKS